MVWNVRNRRKEEKDVCAYTERQYDAPYVQMSGKNSNSSNTQLDR